MNFLAQVHAAIHGLVEQGLLFNFGVACYIIARADYAIRSKQNGVESIRQYVALHTRPLFLRVVIANVSFFGCVPEQGITIPGVNVAEWAVSFFSGLGLDALLDQACQRIPWLRVILPPPINGNGHSSASAPSAPSAAPAVGE